ncbi:AAA family ATPase [Mycobacteroides abscessus]|uniref:AAA family ATPase n=1 Tax=Mycobacteroides abscessus TaxID=36809 RepID=UPI00266C7265|nr:AAA family ATPase [Mycobacteroides abscessus]MDO3331347.1 zeta toxin family protein [Mycobacteroides abscessus subsp. abscessus]
MPLLHVLAGPNGSGKTTYVERVLQPSTQLAFINADVISAQRWPDAQEQHAYDASRAAAAQRVALLDRRRSFITETVFSHPSKNSLIDDALRLGYYVHLHVMLVPVEVTVQRVTERVRRGGHSVPEQKIRERYARLWPLIAQARDRVDRAEFFENHLARNAFRLIASYAHGVPAGEPDWPQWTPEALL